MAHCTPDASQLAASWFGCGHVDYMERAANAFATSSSSAGREVVMINVGANKGYSAIPFLIQWSSALQARLTMRNWKHGLLAFAGGASGDNRTHRFLQTYAAGACAEANRRVEKHQREIPAKVHMLELLESNRRLLRWLVNNFNLTSSALVHNLAASNETMYQPAVQGFVGMEFLGLPNRRAKKPKRGPMLETVTLDEFMARQHLEIAYAVEIDTEGYDALVLEGMRGVLRAHRVTWLEFEYSGKGYWGKSHPEARSLNATQRWLWDLGYSCFLETAKYLAPISGPCWLDRFEKRRWSNVVCSHQPHVQMLYAMADEGYAQRQRQKERQANRTSATATANRGRRQEEDWGTGRGMESRRWVGLAI